MVRSYLRQRRGVLLTFLLFGGLFAVTFALYSLPVQAVAYPFLLCVVAGSILLAADYRQALRRHRQMERVLRLPDEIAASLPPADTVEREDYRQLVACWRKAAGRYSPRPSAGTATWWTTILCGPTRSKRPLRPCG